ncbi:MAG: hypothetical protein U1D06_15335 [Paracoccaceae bacterium]|nr:hypothetical protein [Paracoccaceae bacterium]
MSVQPKSTIAQILFADRSDLNFAHVVGELDRSLDGVLGQEHSLIWDCDDVAIFDLASTRIILALVDFPKSDAEGRIYSTCLTVSVGTVPDQVQSSPLSRRHEGLCSVIADKIRGFYTAEAILWQELPHSMTPEMIDQLSERLPGRAGRGTAALMPHAKPQQDLQPQPEPMPHPTEIVVINMPGIVANTLPDLPYFDRDRLTRVRDALYETPDADTANARPTAQIRLAAHAVNATLVVVCLPLGAALFTYSLLRGEDMRMSAQAVALTGLFMGIAQSPVGQQLVGMI